MGSEAEVTAVARENKHLKGKPCQICGGVEQDPRNKQKRCIGFVSDDGEWVHCSREEHAGPLPMNDGSRCYVHRMHGPCNCGVEHGPARASGVYAKPETAYDYRDATGKLIYQSVRKVLGVGKKKFLLRRPDGKGDWEWNMKGVAERLLYRLPELLAANGNDTVYICEGERDVDHARAWGLVATCNSEGAGEWKNVPATQLAYLAGRDVVVIADDDAPGLKHKDQIIASLTGKVKRVRWCTLPKHDLTDYVRSGATVTDLLAWVAEKALVAKGPDASNPLATLPLLSKIAMVGAERICAIAKLPINYVWQDIAPRGTITMIAGDPGGGKTTLLFLLLIARVTTGAPLHLLGRQVKPADKGQYFVLVEGEHGDISTARKLVRSLKLMGAPEDSLDRVIAIARKAVMLGSPEWQEIETLVSAGLVSDIALDTLARVSTADADKEKEQVELFGKIATTIELAATNAQPNVWVLAHNKKSGTGNLTDVSGSTQRTGQVDSVIFVKAERQNGRVVSAMVTFEKLREEPDDYPMPVAFSIQKNHGGESLHTSVAAADDDQRQLETRVLEQLRFGPKTKWTLREKLAKSTEEIDDAITNLFSTKEIQTAEMKVRGVTRKGFEIRKAKISPDFSPDLG